MNANDMEILVTGATGKQGGAAARRLLARGFRVRAFTRDPNQPAAQSLARLGALPVQGDLDDRTSIDRALQGCYGVFSVQDANEAGVEREVRQGIRLADAAKSSRIRHFVYSSVGSADAHTGIPHFDSKGQIEEHIRSIDIPYSILRPVFFMQNWETYLRDEILDGRLPSPLDPGKPLQQVNVDDIGAFAAMAFADPGRWLGRELDLAGDELTMPQTAETFRRVLEQPVDFVRVDWESFEKAVGREMAMMYHWFNDVGYEVDIEALRQEYPPLSRLEPLLRAQGWRTWARERRPEAAARGRETPTW